MKKYSNLISGFLVALILAIAANMITGLNIYLMIIVILIGIITISSLKMLSQSKEIQGSNVIYENHLNEIQELKETHENLLNEIQELKENKPLQDVGIEEIIPRKSETLQRDPAFLLDAKERICILGTTVRTYWNGDNPFLNYLAQAGKKGVTIQISLLNPESKYVRGQALSEDVTDDTVKSWINNAISELKRFKEVNEIKKMELCLYDEFPVWNMIIVDSRFAKINYYLYRKSGSTVPYYVLNDKGNYNLLPPFIIYFEQLRKRSKKEI